MFKILHRDWNLKPIFTQKWAFVDITPQPPRPGYVQWTWDVVRCCAAKHCGEWSVRSASLRERSLCQVRRLQEAVDLSTSFTSWRRVWSVFSSFSSNTCLSCFVSCSWWGRKTLHNPIQSLLCKVCWAYWPNTGFIGSVSPFPLPLLTAIDVGSCAAAPCLLLALTHSVGCC